MYENGTIFQAEESYPENVETPRAAYRLDSRRGCLLRLLQSDQISNTICPNHHVCPNNVSLHVYVARAPLATCLPVNRVYPFWQHYYCLSWPSGPFGATCYPRALRTNVQLYQGETCLDSTRGHHATVTCDQWMDMFLISLNTHS